MPAEYIYQAYKLARHYPPDKTVLEDISLSFYPGAKFGVIGANGAGKSSLLRIMAGLDDDFNGEARLTPGFTVGYLDQEPQLDAEKDVKDSSFRIAASAKRQKLRGPHAVLYMNAVYMWPFDAASALGTDAMVTDRPGIVLGILTADCVPVLFADPQAGIIGAAHSGWRGTLVGVLLAAIEAMEALGGDRRNIHAAVGPAIAQKSYEVGPDFPAPFIEKDPKNARFFSPSVRDGHYMFDLTGCVLRLLERIGLSSIEHLNLDTCADDERFFSYRRAMNRGEGDYGRGLSTICFGA